MNKNNRAFYEFWNFTKFAFVGVFNTAITFCVYTLLVYLGIHYLAANVIGFFSGVVNSFYWNRKHVFHSSATGLKRYFAFFAVQVAMLCLSCFCLWALVRFASFNEITAQIISTCGLVIVNFLACKRIVFKG